jgi:thiosulfate/3-mercaptopyruvate sulfurtransferase
MIDTYYGLNALSSSEAMYAALLIGFFFGLALERAGFGSSRRLSGVFYFTDMTVIKVMFTALLTAALGLILFEGLGLIDPDTQLYFMPTYYGAYVVAGLIFGIGFVMGGWCPGTAMVGMVSGRLDALVFLAGGIAGSILFNELFFLLKPLYAWGLSGQASYGQAGVSFVYDIIGMGRQAFALLLIIAAMGVFWLTEQIEMIKKGAKKRMTDKETNKATWLKAGLVTLAVLIWLAPTSTLKRDVGRFSGDRSLGRLLIAVEAAEDHVDPENLADLLIRGEPGICVVDVRPPAEFNNFHIREAVNIPLSELQDFAEKNRSKRMIVLYSNGMTHPAQARDALYQAGYHNIFILTDGLNGFVDRCLKPVSLRSEPLSAEDAAKIRAWRQFFYSLPKPA